MQTLLDDAMNEITKIYLKRDRNTPFTRSLFHLCTFRAVLNLLTFCIVCLRHPLQIVNKLERKNEQYKRELVILTCKLFLNIQRSNNKPVNQV